MSFNDYVAASNNSVNDNAYNTKKARSKVHQLKELLKPLMAILRRRRRATYRKAVQPDYFVDDAADQNQANELLEQRIFQDIDCCPEFAAVPVYEDDSEQAPRLLAVCRGQRYVPVHFARTEVGTFFWTTVSAADGDLCEKHSTTGHQVPEMQVPADRWAQA